MKNNYLTEMHLKDLIEKKINNDTANDSPEASVVIVTYNNIELLINNLKSLKKQTVSDFEILIIDNNEKIDIFPLIKIYPINYIKLKKNYGLSLARNIGIKYAKGDIVIFLDDDAIPAEDFVEQHIKAHKNKDIIGLRGKAIPINNKSIYNYFSYHYNYGDKPIPCYINLEGNSSFKKEELINIGGFNPKLEGAGGYEGLELTYRIISKYKDKNKLIYYPNAIIYHDYSLNFFKYIKKMIRHNNHKDVVENQFADILKMTEGYKLNAEILKRESPSLLFRVKMIMIQKIVLSILRIQKLLNILRHSHKG